MNLKSEIGQGHTIEQDVNFFFDFWVRGYCHEMEKRLLLREYIKQTTKAYSVYLRNKEKEQAARSVLVFELCRRLGFETHEIEGRLISDEVVVYGVHCITERQLLSFCLSRNLNMKWVLK